MQLSKHAIHHVSTWIRPSLISVGQNTN